MSAPASASRVSSTRWVLSFCRALRIASASMSGSLGENNRAARASTLSCSSRAILQDQYSFLGGLMSFPSRIRAMIQFHEVGFRVAWSTLAGNSL